MSGKPDLGPRASSLADPSIWSSFHRAEDGENLLSDLIDRLHAVDGLQDAFRGVIGRHRRGLPAVVLKPRSERFRIVVLADRLAAGDGLRAGVLPGAPPRALLPLRV